MFGVNDPFSMVAFIVLVSVGAGVFQAWLKTRNRQAATRQTQAQVQSLERDIAKLRDRVQILEEIATDKDANLRDEIRRLA